MDTSIKSTIAEQIKNLEKIGVILDTCATDIDNLLRIGFFRISQIAKQIHEDDPSRQTALCDIVKIFHYEQSIRGELSEYISYLEVQLRSLITAYYVEWYGAHGYKERKNFADQAMIHGTVIGKVKKQLQMKSLYEVVDDRQIDERNIEDLPVWTAMELSTFPMLTMFIEMLPVEKQAELALYFGVDNTILLSWVDYLVVVRNACAHQGLLFNRKFNRTPINDDGREATVGTAFYILNKLLNYEPFYSIKTELRKVILLEEDAWINKYFDIRVNKLENPKA